MSRLSPLAGLGRNESNVEPNVIGDDGRRPQPVSLQLFVFSPNSLPYSGPPESFDVSPGLPDALPPDLDKLALWKPEQAAFISSAAGLDDETWVGKRPLGAGNFGTAGLWERRNEDNALLEQIVIKESKAVPVENWTGEVPEEVKMMRRLNKTDCPAVPDLIAYKRYMHVRKHRIYMEFCRYSDLATLDLNYKRFRTYLPEPFLWHTFNNLVKVAVAMKYGPKDNNWGYEIVHRDLKPANIFLALEDESGGFHSYPFPKTGDWGLATKIKYSDITNPIGFQGAGTTAYLAPEQRSNLTLLEDLKAQLDKHMDGTAPLQKISAHTNIWAIGAIMFELLTHELVDFYLTEDAWTVNGAFVAIPNARTPKYSSALTELIKLCLMPETRDRPSIEELELKIGAKCQSIVKKFEADPSLRERERLYYKGSEINQMPPGNLNYWQPLFGYVPRPSEPPDSQEIINPFTDVISYPPFLQLEYGDSEEEENVQDDDHTPHANDGGGNNEEGSNNSDNSDVRRRIAMKKLPS